MVSCCGLLLQQAPAIISARLKVFFFAYVASVQHCMMSQLWPCAAGGLLHRGAIEQLAHQAVSEELTQLLASADVQAGQFLVACLVKKNGRCRPLRGPACIKLNQGLCHYKSIVVTSKTNKENK